MNSVTQSTLYKPQSPMQIAAVMAPRDLHCLPSFADICIRNSVETLTVYTLPPDLRLAPSRHAQHLVDKLTEAFEDLDGADLRLVGRRFYLPDHIRRFEGVSDGAQIELRVAIDYAGRPSYLVAPPALALLPDGLDLGNLLRWHFARATKVRVDWPRFDGDDLAALLFDLPPMAVLSRASTPPAFRGDYGTDRTSSEHFSPRRPWTDR